MAIGGGREALMYMRWCIAHPNATKEEDVAYCQNLLNDPENSLRKKGGQDADPKPGRTGASHQS